MARTTTYEFDENIQKALEELRVSLNATSHTTVIRRAVTLLRLAVDTTRERGHVILREEDGTEREVVMG